MLSCYMSVLNVNGRRDNVRLERLRLCFICIIECTIKLGKKMTPQNLMLT